MEFLESLIGKEFLESEFYELVLFDAEERTEDYLGKNFHIYFDSREDRKIKVTELIRFADDHEAYLADRKAVDKREWLLISGGINTIGLRLCRLDRSGCISVVERGKPTHNQAWVLGWADERPPRPPLTDEERRQAFRELAGLLEDSIQLKKLRTKRAM